MKDTDGWGVGKIVSKMVENSREIERFGMGSILVPMPVSHP